MQIVVFSAPFSTSSASSPGAIVRKIIKRQKRDKTEQAVAFCSSSNQILKPYLSVSDFCFITTNPVLFLRLPLRIIVNYMEMWFFIYLLFSLMFPRVKFAIRCFIGITLFVFLIMLTSCLSCSVDLQISNVSEWNYIRFRSGTRWGRCGRRRWKGRRLRCCVETLTKFYQFRENLLIRRLKQLTGS